MNRKQRRYLERKNPKLLADLEIIEMEKQILQLKALSTLGLDEEHELEVEDLLRITSSNLREMKHLRNRL